MASFVFIHGAFRGGWSFARLRPLIERAGHRSFAPSLPGAGEHASAIPNAVSLALYASAVASFLELEDLSDVILVGHSQGGLVASAASQLAHARIAQLVFLDAPLALHGERAVDLIPPALAGMVMPSFLPDAWLPPRPLAASAELSADDAAWINARTCASPVAPSLEPLVLDEPRALALPRSYLFCRRTPDTYPCAHARRRLDLAGTPYVLIDAGHDAPITHPALVAEALLAPLPRGATTAP